MKMRKQRIFGAVLVIISGIVIALALSGTTPEERDATPILLTLTLGIYMMFTENYVLNDGFSEDIEADEAVPEPEWVPVNETTHI